jgi:uncharacterized repeat protein (TIGR01451 family)
MTKIETLARVLIAALLAAAPVALAQRVGDPLESQLSARKVVVAEGRETLVDAASARPGDVIEYVATYRNTGKSPIRGLQATLPIPQQTEFIPGTTRPAESKASLDGRTFADIPLKRKVTRDGKQIEEQVPYREYRALRWFAGELGGEKTMAFTARVRVVDDRNPSEPGSKAGGK